MIPPISSLLRKRHSSHAKNFTTPRRTFSIAGGATATAKPSHAIGHGSPVHVFDRAGRIRVVYDADFTPADLTHDIETLLEQ